MGCVRSVSPLIINEQIVPELRWQGCLLCHCRPPPQLQRTYTNCVQCTRPQDCNLSLHNRDLLNSQNERRRKKIKVLIVIYIACTMDISGAGLNSSARPDIRQIPAAGWGAEKKIIKRPHDSKKNALFSNIPKLFFCHEAHSENWKRWFLSKLTSFPFPTSPLDGEHLYGRPLPFLASRLPPSHLPSLHPPWVVTTTQGYIFWPARKILSPPL